MPAYTQLWFNHTIHFEVSDGTGGPTDIVVGNEDPNSFYFTVPDVIPTKANYSCMGWSEVENDTMHDYWFGFGYTVNKYDLVLYPVWIYNYKYPKLINVVVNRADLNGIGLDTGTYASVKFDWDSGGDVSDTSTIKISWKKSNESVYSDPISTSVSGQTGSFSGIIGNGTLDSNYAYNIKILIENDLRADTYYTSLVKDIPSQYFVIDFLDGGKGIAFGKSATVPGLDINMNTYVHGTFNVDKQIEVRDTTATLNSPDILTTLINGSNEFSTGIHTGKSGDNAASYFSHYQNGIADNSLWLEKDKAYFSMPVYMSSLHIESIHQGDPESAGIRIGSSDIIRTIDGSGFRIDTQRMYNGSVQISTPGTESALGFCYGEDLKWVIGCGSGGTGNDFALYSVAGCGTVWHIIPDGTEVRNKSIVLANTAGIYGQDTYGNSYPLISTNSLNNYIFGDSRVYNVILSNILDIRCSDSNGSIKFSKSTSPYGLSMGVSNATYGLELRPDTNGKGMLGNNYNRFGYLYLVNAPVVGSDIRLKRDVSELDDAISYDFINALDIISYNYLIDESTTKKRIGVLANQMVEVNPAFSKYFVDEDDSEDKILNLRSSDLVYPLIQCVKYLSKKINDLELKIS